MPEPLEAGLAINFTLALRVFGGYGYKFGQRTCGGDRGQTRGFGILGAQSGAGLCGDTKPLSAIEVRKVGEWRMSIGVEIFSDYV